MVFSTKNTEAVKNYVRVKHQNKLGYLVVLVSIHLMDTDNFFEMDFISGFSGQKSRLSLIKQNESFLSIGIHFLDKYKVIKWLQTKFYQGLISEKNCKTVQSHGNLILNNPQE